MEMFTKYSSFLAVFCLVLVGCENNKKLSATQKIQVDSLAIRKAFDAAPVLSPKESLSAMEVAGGFEVELVAAEPLVAAPVALPLMTKGGSG